MVVSPGLPVNGVDLDSAGAWIVSWASLAVWVGVSTTITTPRADPKASPTKSATAPRALPTAGNSGMTGKGAVTACDGFWVVFCAYPFLPGAAVNTDRLLLSATPFSPFS